jgi:hypothetical protein
MNTWIQKKTPKFQLLVQYSSRDRRGSTVYSFCAYKAKPHFKIIVGPRFNGLIGGKGCTLLPKVR